MSLLKKALSSDTFCILPFIHIATKTDGDLKLCCRSWPIGNIKDTTIKELWNSDDYKRIRKQLLEGVRSPECHACWRHEDIGVRSMRQRVTKTRMEQYSHYIERMNDDHSMPFEIPIIEAKLNNFCNLKCRMCHPLDSTSWGKDWKSIEHLMKNANKSTYEKVIKYDLTNKPYMSAFDENEKFWTEFQEMAPFLTRIEFAGGEPLIDPSHYKILHILKPYSHNIEIKYATNLTKLTYKNENIEELWNYFKGINLNISIDGINDIYDYIRQLGDYEKIKENIKKIGSHPKIKYKGAACTLQIYNSFNIPEMFDEFTEELDIEIHTHRVNYPLFLDCRVIPKHLRENIIKNLINYKEKIKYKNNDKWTIDRKVNVTKHIDDAINMFRGGDMTDQISNFVEFSDNLDLKQNVKKTWRELLPELAGALNEM